MKKAANNQGDPRVDTIMWPILLVIRRYVKNLDAVTEIYNRAYEALMISMDINQPSKFDGSATQDEGMKLLDGGDK